jgi:hypothetical protein
MRSRFIEALPPGVVEERRSSGAFGGDLPRRHAAGSTWSTTPLVAPEVESQVNPRYVKGERVVHRKFGSGTVRGLAGHGRELRVMVEFDDTEIGTKQLLVAYAGLERDWESA